MANPYHHAVSSAKKWSNEKDFEKDIEIFQTIHDWFDFSKSYHADFRHRALRHHAEGAFACEREFGKYLTLTSGKRIPVRWVAEQHIMEDLGFIPTLSDWLKEIKPQAWMARSKKLSQELERQEEVQKDTAPVKIDGVLVPADKRGRKSAVVDF